MGNQSQNPPGVQDFMRHIYDNVIAMLAMYERFSVLDALKCLAIQLVLNGYGRHGQ